MTTPQNDDAQPEIPLDAVKLDHRSFDPGSDDGGYGEGSYYQHAMGKDD
jgi:hypothetical protein